MDSTTIGRRQRDERDHSRSDADATRRRNVRLAVVIAAVALLFYLGLWLKAVL